MTPGAPKAVFFGTPELASRALRACIDGGIDVAGVCTRPPRRAGRGRQLSPTPVSELAQQLGIAVLTPERLDGAAVAEALQAMDADVFVVVAYGRIIPASVLAIARYGAVNVHPSLLPAHRGPSPVATAILQGDARTGVSIMLLDAGMDTGPVLWQSAPTPIGAEESAVELSARLFGTGCDMLPQVVRAYIGGDISPTPQDESRASVTRLITSADGVLDWQTMTAEDVLRHCRAYRPWPGSNTTLDGVALKVIECGRDVVPASSVDGAPGRVWAADDGRVRITACDGMAVAPRVVQLAGRSRQRIAEFVRGRPDLVGARLGAPAGQTQSTERS